MNRLLLAFALIAALVTLSCLKEIPIPEREVLTEDQTPNPDTPVTPAAPDAPDELDTPDESDDSGEDESDDSSGTDNSGSNAGGSSNAGGGGNSGGGGNTGGGGNAGGGGGGGGNPPPASSITISGIQPKTGEERLASISDMSITWTPEVEWNSNNRKFSFTPFTDYTATISLETPYPPAGTKVIVAGALGIPSYNATTGTITAVFPRTHYPVNSVNELNTQINDLHKLSAINYNVNKNVFELTSTFYTETNKATSFITIGAGAADNNIPYTIRGLGKDKNELEVGVLLANNNITLEDLRVNISDKDKGVPHQWTTTSYYRSAVSIGRYTTAPNADNNYATSYASTPASKNVTVRNCDISFADSGNMLAGIYIVGSWDQSAAPIQDISIADNNISVVATNNSGSAVQALLVYRYDPSLSITNNGLEAQNNPGTHTTPAGALYMQVAPDINSNYTPLISGNTIDGSPTYDFYINIRSNNDRVGVPELFANKFATPASTWMTAAYSPVSGSSESFYKKLIKALWPQTRTGLGYGYLALYLGGSKYSATDCVFEAYHRKGGKLAAIDFWGYDIADDGKKYKENGNDYANNVQARLLINDTGNVINKNAQFQWSPSIVGNQSNNGQNKPTPLP